MTTQYSPILKLALPVQGELSGTWGDVVNDNITSMVEQAVAGRAVVNTWSANSHTLTTANGTSSEARCAMLELTDTTTDLSGAGTIICPTASKIYIVKNATGQSITVKTAAGAGVLIPNGRTTFLFCDGTNVVEALTYTTSLQLGTSTVVTAVLDEDNMASNSPTSLATQQSIKAYVDAQVGTADTLAEILANGNTSGSNNIVVANGQKITTDTIDETTAGSGVTIDSVLLKDDTVNATDIETGSISANDGTTAATIANSTGVVTVPSAVLTTADINGGTADGVVIGATTPAAATATVLTANTSLTVAGTVTIASILDEDNLGSNSATSLATQQSIKAYVDARPSGATDINGLTDGFSNTYSIGLGSGALASEGGNNFNIGFGQNALRWNASGTSNVAIGYESMQGASSNSHSSNTAIGRSSGFSITTGGDNFFGGYQAGYGATSAAYNVVTGHTAGYSITTGNNNTITGYTAGYNLTTPTGNSFYGSGAAHGNTTGASNVAMGLDVSKYNQTGNANVAIGNNALRGVSGNSHAANTAIGHQAGYSTSTGGNNFYGGMNAGYYNTAGTNNVAVGYSALFGVSGQPHSRNTAIGYQAGYGITTGTSNFFGGPESGRSVTTGGSNNFVGDGAGYALTTGSNNNFYGASAGRSSTTGSRNTYFGDGTGYNAQATTDNTGVGSGALYYNVTGGSNVAIGRLSLHGASGQSHSQNTAIGHQSGMAITTGGDNFFGGYYAGKAVTTGNNNVITGFTSGQALTTGASNVISGAYAGYALSTGSNNVLLGRSASSNKSSGDNTIVIGYNAQGSTNTISNEITLGDANINRFRVPGAGIDNTSAALSGTTPSVDTGARDTYTLTTSGNTTFTFASPPSSGQVGTFSLFITAGGTHTLTWPSSVDWAGGAAPAAPASGAKDVYTFMTIDAGTTWYGFLAAAAVA